MHFWSLHAAASKRDKNTPTRSNAIRLPQSLKGSICYPYVITEHPNVFVAPHSAACLGFSHSDSPADRGSMCWTSRGAEGGRAAALCRCPAFFRHLEFIGWVCGYLTAPWLLDWAVGGRQKVAGYLRVVGVWPHKGFWFSCLFASLWRVTEDDRGE